MVQIIIVHMGIYEHWALLSDRFADGKPMLISNTWRNGMVKEESWSQVVGDRSYKIYKVKTKTPAHVILEKARNAIGQIRYNLLQYNCEHFIWDILTGIVKSTQIRKAFFITGLTCAALLVCKKR